SQENTVDAFICDAVRTPFGRYGGSLSKVRTDDLAAVPLAALMARNPDVDWAAVEDVVYGCANQAGEDNRNVARMALLLAGLPQEVPASTINRLCGSSLDALAVIARGIKSGEMSLGIAGGVESMSRAPFVMGKAETAFSRTAKTLAESFKIGREDQAALPLRSQQRWAAANERGFFASEIVPVTIPQKKGDPVVVSTAEHPRPATTIEQLAKLKGVVKPDGTVTAGNASGVNDGAGALLIASEDAASRYGLTPRARVVAAATAGVEPRIMGIGPIPAARKVLAKAGLSIDQMDVIELNEAFAAQGLAVTRDLGLADDDPRVNP